MSTTPFKLTKELTFDTVIAHQKRLYQHVSSSPDELICIDLSDVTHCDSAGLALLIDVKKQCKKHGKAFSLTGLSDKTRSLAEFCGVHDILA